MNQVRIQSAAAADVEEAAAWYEMQESGLGIEFILELDIAIDLAVKAPQQYANHFPGIRRTLLQRFPYSVYFLFENKTVEVIAVLHQRRAPLIL